MCLPNAFSIGEMGRLRGASKVRFAALNSFGNRGGCEETEGFNQERQYTLYIKEYRIYALIYSEIKV